MTKTTTNLLGIIITILAGIWLYMMLCSECLTGAADASPLEESAVPSAPEATSYPFAFSDGAYAYNVNDNFNFNVSSSTILEPISQDVRDGIIPGLKNHLVGNPEKVITIVGLYKDDERNDSAFPNLGLARANAVKNYFVSQEIPSNQINTMGKLMPEMVARDNVYLGPIGYSIGAKAADTEEQIKMLYEKIEADPLVLYFETGQASIDLSAEQRQKFADISRYLDMVPKADAEVIGYTDNVGRRRANIQLGQERADFAKAYLVRNGIVEDRIRADSRGPRDPIASNDTEEGRAKNRRTVISIR